MIKNFDKYLPDINYIVARWPSSIHLIKKYVMSNQKKPDLYNLSICLLRNLNFHQKHPLKDTFKTLSKICDLNVTYNTYHNVHHFKSTLILATIYGKLLPLKKFDNILLILIALTHDMNHQGRRILKESYYQELLTLKKLQQKIFKSVLSHKKWLRIKKIILNTYFPSKKEKTNDNVEKIILDVDVICSLMFGYFNGLIFSQRLKQELKVNRESKLIFRGFISQIKKKNLHLDLSKKLCTK